MKRYILLILCLITATLSFAQSSKVVKGRVFDANENPLENVKVSAVNSSETVYSQSNGLFEITVSPYAKYIETSLEGYVTVQTEIDGSYLIVTMKVDKKYLENKAKEKEAAEKAEREAALAKEKEEALKAKAEKEAQEAENKRIEAERLAAEKAKKDAELALEKENALKAKAEKEAQEAAKKAEKEAAIALAKENALKAKAEKEIALALEKENALKAKAEKEAQIAEKKRLQSEQLALAKAEKDEMKADRKTEYAVAQSGYASFIDLSYELNEMFVGYHDYYGISYIGGYRFNNKLFIGAGVGVKVSSDTIPTKLNFDNINYFPGNRFKVPVFAYIHTNFIDKRCSPYFALSIGANIATPIKIRVGEYNVSYSTIGVFASPQLGVNFRITPKTSTYLSVGFNAYTMNKMNKDYIIKQGLYYNLDLHFGFTF